ncbi:MAG: nitroreductase/quinone reductase family protein [Chloroflexota bacterium]
MAFSRSDLELIDRTLEVDIETQPPEGEAHRATIWVIVDDDRVFIRSWRGSDARWYREIQANPAATLLVGGQRYSVTAIPATDPDSIERTSDGLRRKYPNDPATERMCREEILDTTLRLEPT